MAKLKRRCVEYISYLGIALSVLVASPVVAQETVDLLLDRLRAIQANENPSAVELKSATIIIDRIVQNFPASEAAVSILFEETYEGIDFKSFERRLEANLNAPTAQVPNQPTVQQPVQPTVQPAVEPTPLVPVQPIINAQSEAHLACISRSFAPQAGAAMQLQVATDAGGSLTGLPDLLVPENTTPQIRVDYLGLAYAIETCAPYLGWPVLTDHVLDLSAFGALSVTSKTDAPAEAPASGLAVFAVPETNAAQTSPEFGITSADTEAVLDLNRLAVRDLQARLLVLGFDPNGVDGSLGKGARSALSSWQASIGVEPTGFLNPLQHENLKEISQDQLSAWLQEADNATLYNPPQKKRKKKRRVRVCKRNAIGVLYDCKYRWR